MTKRNGGNWATVDELLSGDDGKWYLDGEEHTPTKDDVAYVGTEDNLEKYIYTENHEWTRESDILDGVIQYT